MASSGFVGLAGVAAGTTGGVRSTRLCNPVILNAGAEILSRVFFTRGTPQMKTSTLSKIHGSHAWRILFGLWTVSTNGADADLSSGCFHCSFGCQNFSNTATAAIEQIAATISTSHGPWKLAIRNCGIAKASPAVRAAGQTPSMPRKPAIAQTTQNGTINEKNGSWRPTIWDKMTSLMPVTLLRAMIGVPSAPKATGAVLAIRDRPEAASGLKPSWIRIDAVTETGV